ncbi:MAG: transcriptional regulator [Chryseobacterium sp. SCN 40-13]|nr:MAG: transcriptional regulator [Chryseobacterium sp. SCN 40-13]
MKQSIGDRILMILKENDEISVAALANELGITKEGARLHLLKLTEMDLVKNIRKNEGVGRPVTYYSLSHKGHSKFPNTHATVTVELLRSVKKLLGENAVNLLINDRENQIYQRYEQEIQNSNTMEERLEYLSKIRSEEGYMAEWKTENGKYLYIQNHCPIVAAAAECRGFCNAELTSFKKLIGGEFQIERVQHILSGAHRCIYKIY